MLPEIYLNDVSIRKMRQISRYDAPKKQTWQAVVVTAVLLSVLLLIVLVSCQTQGGADGQVGELLIATDRLGDILLIDQTTGEATELLDVYTNDLGTNVGVMTSMVYDPATDTLYAGTGGSATNNGSIYTINLSTGKATLLGSTGLYALPGMALRTTDGAIFTTYFGDFYRIDPADVTNPVSLSGSAANYAGSGMTYDLSGTLYCAGGDGDVNITLYKVDESTGVTSLGNLSYPNVADFNTIDPQFPAYTRITCMTTGSDGKIYGILTDEPYSYLVTVDPATLTVELVGRIGNKLAGLVMIPGNKKPPALAPAAPKGLGAQSGDGAVLLGWNDVFTATSYNIYWSTSSGVTPANGTLISGVTSTFYSHSVAAGTTYYYVVTAVNETGESAPSSEVSDAAGTIGGKGITFSPEAGPFAYDVTSSLPGLGSVTGALDIGFSFTYFGNSYTQFKIYGYGTITFDSSFTAGNQFALNIPANDSYNDIIAVAWSQLELAQGGTISYETRGTDPNRRLIVNFDKVATRTGFGTVTLQLILYETSNLIEIHTTNLEKGAAVNNGKVTQGVEDATGSTAYFYPGRVADVFWLTNDAVRFKTN
ncbi:MAG: hypothetical protein JSV25_03775 [Spirochaetota bacterium]|nr:MAG: hypothetical protein JSV25_03775 [Spirochaetota bacterium]